MAPELVAADAAWHLSGLRPCVAFRVPFSPFPPELHPGGEKKGT